MSDSFVDSSAKTPVLPSHLGGTEARQEYITSPRPLGRGDLSVGSASQPGDRFVQYEASCDKKNQGTRGPTRWFFSGVRKGFRALWFTTIKPSRNLAFFPPFYCQQIP